MLVTLRSGAVSKRRPTQGLGTVHVGVSISQELFVWKRTPTQGLGTAIAGVSLGSCFETKTLHDDDEPLRIREALVQVRSTAASVSVTDTNQRA